MISIRDAHPDDVDVLAQLWFAGWHDAHAQIVPAELVRLRTLKSFQGRLSSSLAGVRVASSAGGPVGLTILKRNEFYQLYVSWQARGTGVAARLMDDALAQFRERCVQTAWLACAIGNDRAARFYEKAGWQRTGTMTSDLETGAGIFSLDVWRFEISLGNSRK